MSKTVGPFEADWWVCSDDGPYLGSRPSCGNKLIVPRPPRRSPARVKREPSESHAARERTIHRRVFLQRCWPNTLCVVRR